ncbi:MAG: histidinol dehydrogenase, partial [Devosiaceae bacterium]|nr:histidinol dehydrogenase [Devosiaceae bacterium]
MVARLHANDSEFAQKFAVVLHGEYQTSQEIQKTVFDILADTQKRGDEALIELTEKFDHLSLAQDDLRFSPDQIDHEANKASPEVVDALKFAHDRIRSHHIKQRPADDVYTDDLGVTLGTRWTPIDAVGIYVPGGLASYPSSVLMNAVPAKVAGVPRIAMVVPTPKGEINSAVMAAARTPG